MSVNIESVKSITDRVLDEVEKAVIGKRPVLKDIMCAILSGGHVLLEDVPGLAKTLVANSFATALGLDFKRIQFTPDLLPGDISGGYIFDRQQGEFSLRKGPIFSNIILADEINRASPKTQSALLEAMEEKQVSLEGETMLLEEPFIVIATQNPVEYESTFPLPEAQLDRFLLKLSMGYPTKEEEKEILKRRRDRKQKRVELNSVTSLDELLQMRQAVEEIHIDESLDEYIIDIITGTREKREIVIGSSPRGSLALMNLARSRAAIEGRDFVLPDDVKHFVDKALSHRIVLNPELWMDKNQSRVLLQKIVNQVPVPVEVRN